MGVVGGRRLLYFVHVWLCYSWRKKRRSACTQLLMFIAVKPALAQLNPCLLFPILSLLSNTHDIYNRLLIEQTPWPLVRKRTILTERPPLVDEI
jgi:hypothetical protein